MPTRRRRQFVHGQLAWMLATVIILVALGALSLELFFVVSLIGFLVVIELTAPFNVTPRWRRRLRWLVAAGLLIFGWIVTRRIMAILEYQWADFVGWWNDRVPEWIELPVTAGRQMIDLMPAFGG